MATLSWKKVSMQQIQMKLSSTRAASKLDRLKRQKMSPAELKSALYFIALSFTPAPSPLKFNCTLNLDPQPGKPAKYVSPIYLKYVGLKWKEKYPSRADELYAILIEFYVTPNWTKIQFSLSRPTKIDGSQIIFLF